MSTIPPTLTPPVSADVAAKQAALQLQGILRRGRNKKWLTPVTLSLKGILSEPDNTNALVPHLADYPVANAYVNARVCDMNANEDEDENYDSCSELESHANVVVLGQHRYIISSSGRHAEVNTFAREVVRMKSVPIVDKDIV